MATWKICDKCGTGKHDNSVLNVHVENIGDEQLKGVPEDMGVDLCRSHRRALHTWITTAEDQVELGR